LRAALGTDLATVQGVITSYVLALAALTLIGGALADTYGKARILVIGCFLFGAASAGCALFRVRWLARRGPRAAGNCRGATDAKPRPDRCDFSEG
jgi:MFS family permease